jgi:hypothetical protein
MSPDEMRDFCTSIQPFHLKVQVRLKNRREIIEGTVDSVSKDRFEITVNGEQRETLRYSWVARLSHAR